MGQSDDTRTISFRIPPDQFERLQEVCSATGMSQSALFRVLLEKHLQRGDSSSSDSRDANLNLELRVKRLESRLASVEARLKPSRQSSS